MTDNHRQDQAALGMLVNWKFPSFWKYRGSNKKPVRIHMDKHKCKLGREPF